MSFRMPSLVAALLILAVAQATQAAPPATPKAPPPIAAPGSGQVAIPGAASVSLLPKERELTLVVDMDLEQTWAKNDPKHPGEQSSKGSGKQHYEITTRLRSDGKLEVRNILDPDLDVRLKAKTIFLARQAKKVLEAKGQKLPTGQGELKLLDKRFEQDKLACNGALACSNEVQLRYAAIYAALQYPEALQEDTDPGVFHYYLPYRGCPGRSRVTMSLAIDGIRYNKDAGKFVPFKERHSADSIDVTDGLQLCDHFAAVIDIEEAAKPMYQETIHFPSMRGITEYTESGNTSREEQSQPFPTEALDWIGIYLRQAPVSGQAEATIPLVLPLNGNATVLGLFKGTAKIRMRWDFREVPAGAAAAAPNPK